MFNYKSRRQIRWECLMRAHDHISMYVHRSPDEAAKVVLYANAYYRFVLEGKTPPLT